MTAEEKDIDQEELRIYEVGYHVSPLVKDEDVEKVVGTIRAAIEKAGGSFIAEGAPSLLKLAYPITGREGGKRVEYDRAHFGWIKFEAPGDSIRSLEATFKQNSSIIRCLVFRTVREDTRAKIKPVALREVKRTDTLKTAPRRTADEAEKAPVSEEQLDKALESLTVD